MIKTRINRIVDNKWVIHKDFDYDFCLDNSGGHAKFCGPLDTYNVLLVKVIDKNYTTDVIETIRSMKDLPRGCTGEINVGLLTEFIIKNI